ncbi:hypothetical protein WISP_42719 [Willisornis vidua]|uniref:DUF7789 domain-containing protein n=1 Tax=Willisornis vidua TaxID=1566151 RepID=A0ABQ9DM56_9PASS|nr:hypothetical protein WISP_42719 [Willisornis vidua]
MPPHSHRYLLGVAPSVEFAPAGNRLPVSPSLPCWEGWKNLPQTRVQGQVDQGVQIKPCSELSFPVKIYFCVTILSLLSVIGLTIETLVRQTEEDFTISFIQLVGVVFCVYYVTRGILQENRQELVVFVLSILLVMLRSITNFTVLPADQKPKLLGDLPLQPPVKQQRFGVSATKANTIQTNVLFLELNKSSFWDNPLELLGKGPTSWFMPTGGLEPARFVLILLVGSFDVVCAILLIQSQGMMAFRVGGALESLQAQYFMLNLCFSMLTFDLQAQEFVSDVVLVAVWSPSSDCPNPCLPQLCLCILLISLHKITLVHNIISATGALWGCLKVTIGIIGILKELKPLVWVFLIQNVPEVVYLIYLLYTVIREWGKGNSYTLEAAFITGSCISVAIKSVLFWALLHVYRSFGQGLRERSEYHKA